MRGFLAFLISLLSFNIHANADCFELAGRDYKIDPDLLRAISWHESKGNIYAIGRSPDNSLDIGLMQINTQHEPELKKYGIKRYHLINDPCMNIYTGAYYLTIAFRKWGVNWDAVGAYNAGFAKNEEQTKRRKNYARKIHENYIAIKTQKKRPNKSRFHY
ncbi:transglycosylase SLT domain-containing protein [Yersinia enterocolitica]|uniref:transglycosylase SLT domain-containing protein n=1 Tax=Yersinia enterocolitica TaxID=630 RepID=UPI003AB30506